MRSDNILHLGLDIGSTTVKLVMLDQDNKVVYSHYARHNSDVKQTVGDLLKAVYREDLKITMGVTGSSAIALSEQLGVEFVQEVVACNQAAEYFLPKVDVAIELGGEDAKILYFGDTPELRMNGVCAGGTGAFIDQMATLLNTDANGLNELAQQHKQIYTIASRCGVFAKTDIQSIINEGASKEDIAASIFQAVANQIIAGLACGKPIAGNIAFLGGPLFFLSELRQRFIDVIKPDNVIVPDDAQVFVAKGAALMSKSGDAFLFSRIMESLPNLHNAPKSDSHIAPLFKDTAEYDDFRERHNRNKVNRKNIKEVTGDCFLGIDAGSTTTKLALIDNAGNLVYSHYGSNSGSPLKSTVAAIGHMYEALPAGVRIAGATVTGYGEALVKAALKIDYGEIETVAHQKGAEYFLPGVDFILDIGGQDMKCIKINRGVIAEISLNEACSSGCGSFIETLAKSLDITLEEFVKLGLFSAEPADLGTRCTVFMNSKIKQVQKEGASVGDIAAGIATSVVKNALYKVIRLKAASQIGEKIVVQGGTFLNDAVLRSFEQVIGRQAVRPDIAGIMGAFGAALVALGKHTEGQTSSMLKPSELSRFGLKNTARLCGLCGNNCLLTVNIFSDEREFILGNRCERGGSGESQAIAPNLFKDKYNRIFNYRPLKKEDAPRGEIGIPRALNMYEHYPFWFTFLTELGYRVVLSEHSTNIKDLGIDTISSDSICYPAKLAHSHIVDLLNRGVKTIFFPCLPREEREQAQADNNYNCPIVTSYPEVLYNNIGQLKNDGVRFIYPFLPIDNMPRLKIRLYEELKEFGLAQSEISKAVNKAYAEREACRNDIRRKGEEILKWAADNKQRAVVLAGRPYHLDPQIHHGVPEMIAGLGMAVLTEDAVTHLGKMVDPLRVLDQWVYHSRLYAAAEMASLRENVEIVQLNSFGCGLDAVTCDQVQEILQKNQKTYTVLKIDEINNLGAARIRIRSLLAALEKREGGNTISKKECGNTDDRPVFTEQMRKDYTILCPQMSPIHFGILEEVFRLEGYNLEVISNEGKQVVEEGLLHSHNDICYPAVMVVGQIMSALKSGCYDLDRTAILMSQTGGGCRASNYIAFIRKALTETGLAHIPVISLNPRGMEKNPGFKINYSLLKKAVIGLLYGDLLLQLSCAVRPYERLSGQTNNLVRQWIKDIRQSPQSFARNNFKTNVRRIIRDFEEIPVRDIKKPKVGIVGEIMVKFHPFSNNFLIDLIERENGEAVMPSMVNFFMVGFYDNIYNHQKLAGKLKDSLISRGFIWWLESYNKIIKKELGRSGRFKTCKSIYELADMTKNVMHLGHHAGEGWYLTGKMLEFIEAGIENIVCLQPFACLPNHVVGKGMIRELKRRYPKVNILPVDYDASISSVNQLNRIKLMMSTAFKNEKYAAAENF